jgi:FkbM family methyltransferase
MRNVSGIVTAGIQSSLLRLYGSRPAQAFIRSAIGDRVFQTSYFVYKRVLEAHNLAALREHVRPDAWIIDVGANIGFFTVIFGGWLTQGKVLALEPEPENFRRLQAMVKRRRLEPRVDARQVAAADRNGRGHLMLSQESHADHRLGESGLAITVATLDSLWIELERRPVGLIKIDVQGAEYQVLCGATALVDTCRPALFVEIDGSADRVPINRQQALFNLLDGRGYRPHSWHGKWAPLTFEQMIAEAQRSASHYADFLFVCD